MLPRETTLSIRVVAPLKVRAQRLAERMGVSVRTARRAARDLDRRRLHFDRTMYRANSSDPHNFDLVLDSNGLGLEIAAEIVAHAVEVGRSGGKSNGPLPGQPLRSRHVEIRADHRRFGRPDRVPRTLREDGSPGSSALPDDGGGVGGDGRAERSKGDSTLLPARLRKLERHMRPLPARDQRDQLAVIGGQRPGEKPDTHPYSCQIRRI